MSTEIVVVNVSEQLAPLPPTLQNSGAFVSQGGTTLAPGSFAALPVPSTLAGLLSSALPLSTLTQSGGVATATTQGTTIASGTYNSGTGLVTLELTASLGILPGDSVVISGATGTGTVSDIDGTFVAGAGSGGTTVEYTIAESLTLTITGGDANYGHGITDGDVFLTTIAGAGVAAYNGTFEATATGGDTFTYAIPSATATPATGNPTFTPRGVADVVAMNAEWWAQSNSGNLAPYVLEVGAGENAAGIAALATYLTANPNSAYTPGAQGFFYSYLVPKSWSGESTFMTLAAQYNNPTSRTRFFTTMTVGNYASWNATNTNVVGLVEAPGIPDTEYSICSGFFTTLNYSPTATSKVPPLNNAFAFDVTPWPAVGNAAQLNAFMTAGVNWISTGAQGGISDTTFVYGTTMDGKSFNFGYAVDWAQINVKIAVSNAIINGSNTDVNPLYYDQAGINTLQSAAAGALQTGISSGLIVGTLLQTELDPATFLKNANAGLYLGQCVINAVPFQTYLNANPGDYALGVYKGFSIAMSPQLGFTQVVFNLEAFQFA
jgi:hypothetical protein